MSNITNLVHSVRDIMRKDAGVDGDAQRISQLVWMIFLKVFDSMEEEKEAEDSKYKSPIPEKIRWRNWAADPEGITGEELLDFVNNKVFKELKNLSLNDKSDPRGFIVKGVFEDAYNYMKNGVLIRQVINKINEIDFTSSEERHLFNDIYEGILRELQSAGSAGEFYTPRPVTQFIVDMVNPKIGEKVLDPACGTGGFLVSVLNHLKHKIKSVEDQEKVQNNLFGIDKKQLPHLLCMTNLILHDIEVPKIRHDNSLAKPLVDYTSKDMVDVVVTNPPFGGAEEEGIENYFPAEFRTRETADLFLILIMKLLKDGGRCGIVLPDGFLFGEGVKTRIKEKLLSEFNLHTIVRLPNGVFSPYTGIRTNLLFFEKDSRGTKDIWYFEHPLPENYKIYNKTKPIRHEEFELEKEWWKNRNNEKFKQYAWKVSKNEILKRGFNLDIKNPKETEQKKINSEELHKEYIKNKESISQIKFKILENLPIKKEKAKFFLDLIEENPNKGLLKQLILKYAFYGYLTNENIILEDNNIEDLRNNSFRSLPLNWKWKKVWDLRDTNHKYPLGDGDHGLITPKDYISKGIPYIRVKDIINDKLELSNVVFIDNETHKKVLKSELHPGDILIAKTGATIGKCCIIPPEVKIANTTSSVAKLTLNNKIILNKYFYYYVLSKEFQDQMWSYSQKTAQPGFNNKDLKIFQIPVPNMQEQKIVVEKVERLITYCDELEKQVKENKENAKKLMEAVLRESFEDNF